MKIIELNGRTYIKKRFKLYVIVGGKYAQQIRFERIKKLESQDD